jgi:small subunit ribosomal protein S17
MARQLKGKVISNKMTKTVVVAVERFVKHPRYQKIIRRTSKLKARADEPLSIGDKVTIEECRPIAKTVNFIVKN